MASIIKFDKNEVPYCPNGCGLMHMEIWDTDTFYFSIKYNQHTIMIVPEARAFCLNCKHTMIVADERASAILCNCLEQSTKGHDPSCRLYPSTTCIDWSQCTNDQTCPIKVDHDHL